MFVSFQNDSGIRFSAHFYDAPTDSVETRTVTGWVTGDDGVSQATVLVPEQGIQIRVGVASNFLAVIPNGQEEKYEALLEARKLLVKKALEEQGK
jgi:hypothetical protein